MAGGVRQVHLVEVAGEQVGLLAPLGAADLDDDVATGVRIGRHHQLGELGLDGRERVVRRRQLRLGQLAFVARRLGEQLAGRVGIGPQGALAAGRGDDRRELVVAASDGAQLGRVGRHRRVGEARLEVGVLLLDGGEAAGDGIHCGRPRLSGPGDATD